MRKSEVTVRNAVLTIDTDSSCVIPYEDKEWGTVRFWVSGNSHEEINTKVADFVSHLTVVDRAGRPSQAEEMRSIMSRFVELVKVRSGGMLHCGSTRRVMLDPVMTEEDCEYSI